MADIDDRIRDLEDAIASGAKRIVTRTGNTTRETEFHSLKEMRDLLTSLKAEKAGSGRSRIVLAGF